MRATRGEGQERLMGREEGSPFIYTKEDESLNPDDEDEIYAKDL